jgi:hypothetical protein
MTFIVSAATNCAPTHVAPTINALSNINLSCSETTRAVTLSGSGTVGASIIVRNASGTTIGTTTVDANRNWYLATSL